MMNNELLDLVKKHLNLRRLEKLTLFKNKKSLQKLVIGFVLIKDKIKLKINFTIDVPNFKDQNDLIEIISNEILYFNKKIESFINKYILVMDIFKENDDTFLTFKNNFLGALSNFSSYENKEISLKLCFEKMEKQKKNIDRLKEEEFKLKKVLDQLQITEYHNYFKQARQIKRKLKLYIGPTNSGKTFKALNDLTNHSTGTYLSPLRLLAWEGKDEIEKRGFNCSLITGEEKVIVNNSNFKAQTIETLNFNETVDAILIDEIQMLFDKDRGWAWTQALIGSPCKELIMAGAPEAEEIVTKIASFLGEELEVIHLSRFNPLEVSRNFLDISKNFNKIDEGAAFIAFSRKKVLEIKKYFEKNKMPVSVIYGNLSPDVRKEEARRFREGETKYLISTDAISMGLNLPISTIVFTTIEKFNGRQNATLSPMEIKQISGRAGRYGKSEKGTVTALDNKSLKYIQDFINFSGQSNDFLYIKPSIEHVRTISEELSTTKLFPILTFFTNKVMSKLKNIYVCSDLSQYKELALMLDKIQNLSLDDRFLFNNAPVPGEDHYEIYFNWINQYQKGKHISVPTIKLLNPYYFKNDKQLILENFVKLLNLYSWLSYKKPLFFPDLEKCFKIKEESNLEIERFLSFKQR